MTSQTIILVSAAVSVGFIHTILGPDHYVPFIAMGKAGAWSRRRTLVVTALCGLGHVAGSVILGLVGIAFGLSLSRLEAFEASRGSLAAWGLILFGLAYAVWGLKRGVRGHRHSHIHVHADGTCHAHEHQHEEEHLHVHADSTSDAHEHKGEEEHLHVHAGATSGTRMTPWVLFVIFLFGPCEALIPLLMFPAATESIGALFLVTLTFGTTTIATMLGAVLIGTEGLRWTSFERSPVRRLAPYGHLAAGVTVLLCGVAIQFLGL